MQTDLWQEVMQDMESRRQEGYENYGVPFLAGDGRRDGALDLYEELLDAVVYVHKIRKERSLLRQGLLRAARMKNTATMSQEILYLIDRFLLTDGHRLDDKAALHELPTPMAVEAVQSQPDILPMTGQTLQVLWPFDDRIEGQLDWDPPGALEEGDADE